MVIYHSFSSVAMGVTVAAAKIVGDKTGVSDTLLDRSALLRVAVADGDRSFEIVAVMVKVTLITAVADESGVLVASFGRLA